MRARRNLAAIPFPEDVTTHKPWGGVTPDPNVTPDPQLLIKPTTSAPNDNDSISIDTVDTPNLLDDLTESDVDYLNNLDLNSIIVYAFMKCKLSCGLGIKQWE